jgi:hypothetical protein
MDSNTFDAFAIRLGATASRRRVVTRLAQAGGAAALVAAFGRSLARDAAAQGCPYGANTCASGYVWREAYAGDVVCVDPSQRAQAASDNANAAYRVDSSNPPYCLSGYVWRDAYDGDAVCVEPWVRDQVHYDNAQSAFRIASGCGLQVSN